MDCRKRNNLSVHVKFSRNNQQRTIGKAVLSLNFIYSELDLSESVLVILVEIGEREFQDSSLQSISGILCGNVRRQFLVAITHRHTNVTNLLIPADRLTKVFPTFLVSKIDGALISYQSVLRASSVGCVRWNTCECQSAYPSW